ncbi:MAG: NAD(P)-dependent oxidoreductase, partial [Ruegeria sp.]|nr:NAD(P)-dependent oxidoreductase [Ruegeria sp.]
MTISTGFIGLGKMGASMASNLLQAGFDLTVYNRSFYKCAALRDAGANVASSASDVAKSVDVVCLMLSDDTSLRQVALGDGGVIAAMRPGAVLVEMSTVSGEVSVDLASAAADQKIGYVRAPVSGSVSMAEAGTLTFIVSGDEKHCERVRPVLESMSGKQFYVGVAEEARYLKLAINLMVGATAAVLGEALALGECNGLDRNVMLDVVNASTVASPLLKYKTENLRTSDYSPAFEVTQMAKDFDLVLGAARSANVPMPLAAQVHQGWSALIAQGDG